MIPRGVLRDTKVWRLGCSGTQAGVGVLILLPVMLNGVKHLQEILRLPLQDDPKGHHAWIADRERVGCRRPAHLGACVSGLVERADLLPDHLPRARRASAHTGSG